MSNHNLLLESNVLIAHNFEGVDPLDGETLTRVATRTDGSFEVRARVGTKPPKVANFTVPGDTQSVLVDFVSERISYCATPEYHGAHAKYLGPWADLVSEEVPLPTQR